jgi:hypothetical protein
MTSIAQLWSVRVDHLAAERHRGETFCFGSANKTKPNLAKLTIARQIAPITRSLWGKEVAYDLARLIKNS